MRTRTLSILITLWLIAAVLPAVNSCTPAPETFIVYGIRTHPDGDLGGKPITLKIVDGNGEQISASLAVANVWTTYTNPDGSYKFDEIVIGEGRNFEVSCQGYAPQSIAWEQFTEDGEDKEINFELLSPILEIGGLEEGDDGIPTFDVFFRPVCRRKCRWFHFWECTKKWEQDEETMYIFSHTKPWTFFLDIIKEGEPGEFFQMNLILPQNGANAEYDSPNFQVHRFFGKYPDIRIYKGEEPRWRNRIRDLTVEVTPDGKYVHIEGYMPEDCGTILVKVHCDYRINGQLTETEKNSFKSFFYTFNVEFSGSWYGGSAVFGVG